MLWCLFCSRACWAEPCIRCHLDPSNLQRWRSARRTLHPASASYSALLHLAPWFQYRSTLQRSGKRTLHRVHVYRALVFDTLPAHAKKPSYMALSACLKGCRWESVWSILVQVTQNFGRICDTEKFLLSTLFVLFIARSWRRFFNRPIPIGSRLWSVFVV